MTVPPDEPDERPAEYPPAPPVMPTADEDAAAQPYQTKPAPVRYAFVVWVLQRPRGVPGATTGASS